MRLCYFKFILAICDLCTRHSCGDLQAHFPKSRAVAATQTEIVVPAQLTCCPKKSALKNMPDMVHKTPTTSPLLTWDRPLSPWMIQFISLPLLLQELPGDSGNFPWYVTDSIAAIEDGYSEVVVNVIDFALNWQLFSAVLM